MHPLQRRAVLGLIVMVESALQQIRSLIALEPEAALPVTAPQTSTYSPSQGGYLSDKEEDDLERMLEEERAAAATNEGQIFAQRWDDV